MSRRVQRANSAYANLQSHPCFQSDLFTDSRPNGNFRIWREKQEHLARPQSHLPEAYKKFDIRDYQLENTIWSQSVKTSRRLTLNQGENISDWEIRSLKKQKSYVMNSLNTTREAIEEKLSLDALNQLMIAFLTDTPNFKHGELKFSEFREVLRNALKTRKNDKEITELFTKINFASKDKITWDEFCSFMQLNFSEKEEKIKRQKEVKFITPARMEMNPHRNLIQKVSCTSDGNFMVMSMDGVFSLWAPNGDLKKMRREIIEKRSVNKDKGEGKETKRNKANWITDFEIVPEINKILIGTGDRELQFWELSSFEPYCQISSLETVPIKLSYSYMSADEVIVTFGDTDGCVNILIFRNISETLRLWKSEPVVANMPTITFDKALEKQSFNFARWKTHNDWVEQIRIDKRLNQIISCSNDENNAVVIGCVLPFTDINTLGQFTNETGESEPVVAGNDESNEINKNWQTTSTVSNMSTPAVVNSQPVVNHPAPEVKKPAVSIANQQPQIANSSSYILDAFSAVKRRPHANETVFKINKGVKTFDFSFEKNLLITGGMDRIVRLYNPYVPNKPIACLKNHNTPLFFIHLCSIDNRIFTISSDKSLNVWDLVDHSCLASIRPKSHKINGELQACSYSSKNKSMLIATDKFSFLSLKLKSSFQTDIILSHKEPVVGCLYVKETNRLISCSEAGTVKLWDLESGKELFEFTNVHGDQSVTCCTLDESAKRLITGGRDGLCKIWNFNNGQLLKVLKKNNILEVSDVKYIKVNNNKFIVNVGWDRSINLYEDEIDDIKMFSYPGNRWEDDIRHGHKEDIITIAKSESNFVATSAYDGEIIIWNMISGHIFSKLKSPSPGNLNNELGDGDLSVNSIVFMNKENFTNKRTTHLISSGPWKMVHFWSVFGHTEIKARFKFNDAKHTITKMCTDLNNMNLFASDSNGFIYHWDINGYALVKNETKPPQLMKKWRAHVSNVTALVYIESATTLISSATDCTIRVWSRQGEYIGTFGQDEIWNLYDVKTYKHPSVPYDVLIDSSNLPKLSADEEEQKENKSAATEKPKESAGLKSSNLSKVSTLNDDAIEFQIKKLDSITKIGKRLWHEKNKITIQQVDKGGEKGTKNYYQMLKCFNYDPKPDANLLPDMLAFKKNCKICDSNWRGIIV